MSHTHKPMVKSDYKLSIMGDKSIRWVLKYIFIISRSEVHPPKWRKVTARISQDVNQKIRSQKKNIVMISEL